MTDQTTPGGAMPPEAGATPTQTAAAGTAGTPATGATAPDADALAALGDPGKRALDAMKVERTAAERRADAAEKALKALQDAQLSESEKKDKRLAELETAQADWQLERQRMVLERTVERQAAKVGADPELTLAMVLANRGAVEFEADGTPRNLDRIIGDLVKAKPGLLTARPVGSPDAGTGGRAAPAVSFTREQLRDTKFYAEHKAEILKAMQENRIR